MPIESSSLPPPVLEAVHDAADHIASHDLATLLRWLLRSPAAPAQVEGTLRELGLPEPEEGPDGTPVPGSAFRRLLHWTQAGVIADELTRLYRSGEVNGTTLHRLARIDAGAVPEMVAG